MKRSHIYLIGAGPGDPELISIKAKNALSKSDVIVYDYLANENLIKDIDCEKIYVGKKGGDHTLPQEDITKLIIKKAKENKIVSRLKGGDTFIFGRGGEEAEEIVQENISFSIIPGISSFYSAPAYAGIPLTHRDCSDAFEVITGHKKDNSDKEINLPEYNDNKTFVFLMGMKNLELISRTLINEKKFPEDFPVAIISWGTTEKQRTVTGTLKNIYEIAQKESMKPPAIIIMGNVVKLRDKLRWFDTRPLFGTKIAVTRTREQASKLSKGLREFGADVIEFPTIKIKPLENNNLLDNAIDNISNYSWIIFTSTNGVNIFFKRLFEKNKDSRSINSKIAVIGQATGEELLKYGISPDLIPERFVAESLLESFKNIPISKEKILIPCAEDARYTLTDGLKEMGGEVDRIHTYKSVLPEDISARKLEKIKDADIITFTSSSTVTNFFSLIPETGSKIASIGPITSKTLEKFNHGADITAEEFTIKGLIDAILKFKSESRI